MVSRGVWVALAPVRAEDGIIVRALDDADGFELFCTTACATLAEAIYEARGMLDDGEVVAGVLEFADDSIVNGAGSLGVDGGSREVSVANDSAGLSGGTHDA